MREFPVFVVGFGPGSTVSPLLTPYGFRGEVGTDDRGVLGSGYVVRTYGRQDEERTETDPRVSTEEDGSGYLGSGLGVDEFPPLRSHRGSLPGPLLGLGVSDLPWTGFDVVECEGPVGGPNRTWI